MRKGKFDIHQFIIFVSCDYYLRGRIKKDKIFHGKYREYLMNYFNFMCYVICHSFKRQVDYNKNKKKYIDKKKLNI